MDLASYDAAVSFDAVPVLPDPEIVIRSGEAGTIVPVGVWLGDGSLRLEVRQSDAVGGAIATLTVGCPLGPCDAAQMLNRSTTESVLAADAHLSRETLVSGLSYRVYDGVFSSTGFSFWISNNELWRDWCAPQLPRAFALAEKTVYACGSGVDPVMGGLSDDNAAGRDVLCKLDNGVCSCAASGCRWNAYTAVTNFKLDTAGDGVMRGSMKSVYGEPTPLSFVRMSGASL
jgi:hypothetical protein